MVLCTKPAHHQDKQRSGAVVVQDQPAALGCVTAMQECLLTLAMGFACVLSAPLETHEL